MDEANSGLVYCHSLPERPKHLSQLALDFENGSEILIGFQDDRRAIGLDSLGDRSEGVVTRASNPAWITSALK
jgi:hypothetical protein